MSLILRNQFQNLDFFKIDDKEIENVNKGS